MEFGAFYVLVVDIHQWAMAHLWTRIWCGLYGSSHELPRHSILLVRTQFVESACRNCSFVSWPLPAYTKRYAISQTLKKRTHKMHNVTESCFPISWCVTKNYVDLLFVCLSLFVCKMHLASFVCVVVILFCSRFCVLLHSHLQLCIMKRNGLFHVVALSLSVSYS